jgi:hypothetical protein
MQAMFLAVFLGILWTLDLVQQQEGLQCRSCAGYRHVVVSSKHSYLAIAARLKISLLQVVAAMRRGLDALLAVPQLHTKQSCYITAVS